MTTQRANVWATLETKFATSRDGTRIVYRQVGHGPSLVVLHGTMSSGYNHLELAQALADTFTVYLPDRRGRGLSGPHGEGYGLEKEVQDLDALLAETGAQDVFGVSSGGLILLRALGSLPALGRAAIYEAPLPTGDDAAPTAALERIDRELAQQRPAAALITGMIAGEMEPPLVRAMPRWLLERLATSAISREDRLGSGDYVPMKALAPTLRYDFQLVVEMRGKLETVPSIANEVLLLGGSKSPAYLKRGLDALEKALSRAQRVQLPGLDHAASWNRDRGGKPNPVAFELRRFFAEERP